MGASAGTGMQTRRFAEGGAATGSEGTTQAAPQRAIYRPQYTDYSAGLGATPQAGYLSSKLGIGQPGTFTPQMPTFTRPQAVQQAPSYSIPYANKQSTVLGTPVRNLMKNMAANQDITKSLRANNLTQSQYDSMMADPSLYLPYVQSVRAGEAAELGRQEQPIQFMTMEQRVAYNNKQKRELDRLLRPITVFEEDYSGGS